MDVIDQRFLIYIAVIFISSVIATFAGLTAGIATFSFVTVGVEFTYWAGGAINAPGQSRAAH